jgi:putative secretion ATPase (PEP-CTERM system associated)
VNNRNSSSDTTGEGMYESYFKLTKKPFDLLPNPDFMYLSKSHKRALTYLNYGIKERSGFILLTGEVGSGKTTIIRDLIKKNHERVLLGKIFNTRVSSDQLISMINDDFGLPVHGKDKIELLRDLNVFLIEQYAKGAQPTLVIDEAQNLSASLLEEVRLLSNLETDNAKLMQIILVGQPELRKTLARTELLQLRQRISINCHLQPLTRLEVEEYIQHRLDVAGDRSAVIFEADALDNIFKYSKGIPRLINIICDFLMLSACAEGLKTLGGDMVDEIIGELDFENQYWKSSLAEADPVPAVHGDTPPAEHTAEFSSVLLDIRSRLESLEKDSTRFNTNMINEIGNRIKSVQTLVTAYRGETDNSIGEIRRKMESFMEKSIQPVSRPVVQKEEKPNFIRRIFGN